MDFGLLLTIALGVYLGIGAIKFFEYPKRDPDGVGWIQRDGSWSLDKHPIIYP